ncbi:uncharacterized protein LOC112562040 isoform X3 [Pomacea canaliculata]|uniref:uncharacterized protein LOC112562040 isoform X3 n=1 Tax=Pomacea canaliculata TaxID=400727 RepID=UPI000D728E1E|nr:uncharacterized protein LOC112562040 isoform X3 [Pomacea canaliculata]
MGHTCMGNLARCTQGITLSAWMKFRSFENDMVFLSTGQNGLLMIYRDGYVHVSADGRGLVTTPRFETDRWYHVEISWHPSYGLRLYVDNELKADSPRVPIDDRGQDGEGRFYIGRPNNGDMPGGHYTTGNFDIDELEVWYGRREDLIAFGYIDRGSPVSSNSPNGASLVSGHVGQAVALDGRGQYVDLGSHIDSCLGNLDLCPHGFTMSVWLKPGELRENTHYIAGPAYSLFYEDGELKAEFSAKGRAWNVATPNFHSGEWQRVTLAWHAKRGLSMFVNDELMDTSSGEDRVQDNQPASDHVYLGRNLVDTRLTADVQADELQVWYDQLDQLRATGRYEVQIMPRLISFDNWRDGRLTLRDRVIYAIGEVRLVPGLGQGSSAVYLDGHTQYIDLGSNFTCNGNLDMCRQGATIRLALKPNQLVDGAYILDSFPVKVYYKDGRIYAEMQTSTQVWQVNTADINPGEWSRMELTWHPTFGLALYVNGRRVGYQTFPRTRPPVSNSDWRSFLGRPLNDADGSHANIYVDNLEFYNGYQSYIPQDNYLSLIQQQEPLPGITTEIIWVDPVTTQRPPIIQPRPASPTTIIRFNGASYVKFDFSQLPSQYLTYSPDEEFSFWFLTDQPEGLLWYHQEPKRNLYLAIKDGYLVFVNDNKSSPPEEVYIGRRDGKRFNDFKWYKINIRRSGRRIRITVDDKYPEEYIFSENVQFLVRALVYLGGSDNTIDKTRSNIRQDLKGGLAEVVVCHPSKRG